MIAPKPEPTECRTDLCPLYGCPASSSLCSISQARSLLSWNCSRPLLSIPILLLSAAYVVLLLFPPWRPFPTMRKVAAPITFSRICAFALCVAWVYYSGIGSFALCRWDYVKHNLIFSYLLDQKLPIYTSLSGQDFIFHYSFAYYITPVRLYQVAHALAPGVTLNGVLLAVYSVALFLAASILSRGRMTFLLVLLAVLCLTGGLDVLGMLAFGVEPQGKVATCLAHSAGSPQSRMVGCALRPAKLHDESLLRPATFFRGADRHRVALCVAAIPAPCCVGLDRESGRHSRQRVLESLCRGRTRGPCRDLTLGIDSQGTIASAIETRRVRGHTRAAWSRLLRLCSSPFPRRISVSLGLQASYIS